MEVTELDIIMTSPGPGWSGNADQYFVEIVTKYGDCADLIAFPGWTLSSDQFENIKGEIAGISKKKARVLWEVGEPSDAEEKAKLVELYSNQCGDFTCHGRQFFVSPKDRQGRIDFMNACDDWNGGNKLGRWIKVKGKYFFWLNCGEIFLLRSPQNTECSCPRDDVKEWFEGIKKKAAGFFNPTHTEFQRRHITAKQARYLSQGNRIFLRPTRHDKADRTGDDAYRKRHLIVYRGSKFENPSSNEDRRWGDDAGGAYMLSRFNVPAP
ncbi:hypothetical protein [Nitrospirillum sp. BR 11163]|uniref:hypothetical protein n=1 Tax=Nitrospirillum sp. BR 11163 TaxID=3104323 RepID=UPI002AFE2844|nr:hypothetical protein [Nitrospirillum sp. BR 11163]MEA1675171.1 hypothetical protein [Nitrospirillum sp. BR 11163]